MARKSQEKSIDTREARSKLKARPEPYWHAIVPGLFLGYRKTKTTAAWIARRREGAGYVETRIGSVDDLAKADGAVVLSYAQAVKGAQSAAVEKRTPSPRHYGDAPTLNALFDDYLADRAKTPGGRMRKVMAPGTVEITRGSWKLHAAGSIGDKPVTALDAKALRTWHVGIAASAPTNRGKVMDFDHDDPEQRRSREATANRVLTVAKAALTWARAHDRLPADMADWWRTVEPFALGDDPEPRMLEQAEITRLLNAAAPDLRDLLSGALMTGARYGELRTLKVSAYSEETATVRLYQHKTYKTLTQPLTPEGVALFDRLTAGRDPGAFVFIKADGQPWGESDAQKPMRAAVAAAKLDDVTFKTMRASYGKLLLLATKDIELVARALGHSDSRITRAHYARHLPSEVARGIALMPALGIAKGGKVVKIGRQKRKA